MLPKVTYTEQFCNLIIFWNFPVSKKFQFTESPTTGASEKLISLGTFFIHDCLLNLDELSSNHVLGQSIAEFHSALQEKKNFSFVKQLSSCDSRRGWMTTSHSLKSSILLRALPHTVALLHEKTQPNCFSWQVQHFSSSQEEDDWKPVNKNAERNFTKQIIGV